MKFRSAIASVVLLCGAFMASSTALAQDEIIGASDQDHSRDTRPDGRGNHTRQQAGRAGQTGSVTQGNGINYHGGPVIHGTVNVYFIWYGNWAQDPTANSILTTWANNIGGSPYEDINTTYGDTTGNVSGLVSYGGSVSDSGSLGTSLSDSSIATLVSKALGNGLPIDPNGVYFVLTAPYVKETSGFLSQYCGWHTYGTLSNGTAIKYAFVGNPAADMGACAEQSAHSPNGDPEADAMISVMSHELEESASDPELNAWYDSQGNENADKCAWTFGTTYSANGGLANMNINGIDYLIQRNWLNANGGKCALAYTVTPDFSLSVSPTSQTLASTGGATGNYTITETAVNGFTGGVSYAITGLPSWATASAVSGAGTFTVSAANPVQGTHNFTITGSSNSPVLSHSITASLVVSAPPPPSFTISISPGSNSVTAGGKVTYTVTIAPVNGFSGNVSLTTNNGGPGLNLSLNPTSVTTSGTSTLTATDNNARKGNVTLTVTGKSGSITKSVNATLSIN